MKYVITFIWAVVLFEMVNFVLNSLGGGGPLNVVTPIALAVFVFVIILILDTAGSTPNNHSTESH
ncbi:YjzD family protein [Staphylococcus sp. IVB6246]|uniref:YjzD family protein n=1 Tax=Staphylococcus sp. IVB6246 TaxID=2989772 RepID=UPI0021CE80D4|nr:YjzD family protein [Staphylococcus sp. IVB6246]UXR70103.1 YjzD family protein [Staphylococcus sp. IVB6246]